MRYFIISTLIIAINAVHGAYQDLTCKESANSIGDKCRINNTCEFNCKFHCCNLANTLDLVQGSVTYSSGSSICRSALHDLRISLTDPKLRRVKVRRFYQDNCFLESSVRFGFSSSTFQNESCDVFEFVNPRIPEVILDVVSMHSDYLYGHNEYHTQVCAAPYDFNQIVKFGVYSNWETCNVAEEVGQSQHENSIQYTKVWYNFKSAGFQCFSNKTMLSIITSIAFRKDASFFPKHLTVTVNKYENVTLIMDEADVDIDKDTEWKKDNKIVKQNIGVKRKQLSLINVNESSSGIYSLAYSNSDNEKPGFVQLIVRTCPRGKYGDDCSNVCHPCLNGGICHGITDECVCAPGFNGSTCETACQPGYLGKKCNIKCISNKQSSKNESCKGLLICLPSPYGCSCASGFTGLNCDKVCQDGYYGAGCLQQHKHDQYKKGTCSKFFDFCECQNGWHGAYCNESYPVLSSKPSLINYTANSIALTFSKWLKGIDRGSGSPAFYEVIFKEMKAKDWTYGPNMSARNNDVAFQVLLQSLKPATKYTVGVLVIDESGNKQEMGLELLNIMTACDTPSAPPSDIQLYSSNQRVTVQWTIPPEETWNCWNIDISVKVRESSSNSTKECIMEDTYCFFYSDPFDTWIIEVCASSEGSEENCNEPKNITVDIIPFSSPVELEVIKKDTTLYLMWVPPRFASRLSHYNISHEDLNTNISISTTIKAEDAVCEGDKISHHCYAISNLIVGHYYRIEIVAFYFNIMEGSVIRRIKVKVERSSVAPLVLLGISLPLLVILAIITLILFLQRRKVMKSSLKVKFITNAIESEFGLCNEALDEMDIIETESMCEEISNPISLEELPEYVKQSIQNVKIRKEFMSVPTGQIYPCSVAKLGENKPKNRYGNILPYDHSRVILDTLHDDLFSNYIHASYIHGYNKVKKYIATQGPLMNTINDFWRMTWNEGSCKILMITNFVENGKYKCEMYWEEDSCKFGEITVSCEDSKCYADFVIRTFKISKDKVSREVKQFHFLTWPDHGAPSNVTPFINYLKKARDCYLDSEAPIIVHCSAGIGRTGTTILLDSMIDMALEENRVDLVSHLCSMRKQRMNIVENFDQYVFVYQALVESLCIEDTCVHYSDFKKEYERLKNTDAQSGISYMEKQFQALNQLTVELMYKDVQGAYQMENQSKNRTMLILPPDRARPFLSRDSSGYINAVFVDSFTVRNAYIATQYPLHETVYDFWSMIYEQKSKIVVLLNEMDFSMEETPQLWSPEGGIQTCGDFEVECQSVIPENEISLVNIIISSKNEDMKEPLSVSIVVLKNWAFDSNLPMGTSSVLSAISKVHSLNSDLKSIITVICSDGVTACGLFCASLYICDEIKAEQEIDVFYATKCIRTNRHHFISNLEQYEFLFEVISSYLDSSQM